MERRYRPCVVALVLLHSSNPYLRCAVLCCVVCCVVLCCAVLCCGCPVLCSVVRCVCAQFNSALHTLDLGHNQIDANGAQALAEALTVHTTL